MERKTMKPRVLNIKKQEHLQLVADMVEHGDGLVEQYQYMTQTQIRRDDIGIVSQKSNPNLR